MRRASAAEAASVLASGGVALVPTETVVGLVAAEAGLPRLAEIKARDAGKPIALLCRTPAEALALAREVPPLASELAARYWPGPLTMVLADPGGGTVGVRVPDHPAVAALLDAFGGPLYATSANIAGEPPPRSLDEVDPRVAGAVEIVLEGEPGGGEASAVVDLSGGEPRVLRPAAGLTQAAIEEMSRGD